MNRTFIPLLFGVTVVATAIGLEAQQHGDQGHGRPHIVRQFVGGGKWQSHRHGAEHQGWQVQMKHFGDDSLDGHVVIVGSPLVQRVRIVGHVTGTDVDGVLLDEGGSQVGSFSGSISKQGITGTYVTSDGDTGDWAWDGPPPE